MITNYKKENIDLFNFKEEDFCIEDVIIGLPNICRYGGRTPNFFSVGQHCVELSKYLRYINKEYLCPLAILHDAAEVYIGDIIFPIKSLFPDFLKFEDKLTNIIYNKYNIDKAHHKEFNYYDKNIVVNEMRALNIWEREKHLCSKLSKLPNLDIKEIWNPLLSREKYLEELLNIFPNIIIDFNY